MTDWQPIETLTERQEVLLCWTWPDVADAKPIVRLGSLFTKGYSDVGNTYKIEVDLGDASAMFFTSNKDDQPTHWAKIELPQVPA